jgi:hypothetical protein
MSRKGFLVFEVSVWIVRILMTIIVIIGLALQIRASINARSNLDFVEPALLLQVLASSPEVLYSDSAGNIGRMIDLQRFEKANLDDSLHFEERHFAAMLAIVPEKKSKTRMIYVNRQYFDELAAQEKAFFGRNVAKAVQQWPVRFIDNGIPGQGILYVEVLQPA